MSTFKALAYTDDKGNRMIFPCDICWAEEDENIHYEKRRNADARYITLSCIMHLKADKEWTEFDQNHFPHVRTEIGHRNFLHGGATVYLFAGPWFDEVLQEQGAAA